MGFFVKLTEKISEDHLLFINRLEILNHNTLQGFSVPTEIFEFPKRKENRDTISLCHTVQSRGIQKIHHSENAIFHFQCNFDYFEGLFYR